MMWRIGVLLGILLLIIAPVGAQDGFNLPSELYVLTNDGAVERYGVGAEGVMSVTPEGEFALDMAVAPDGNWLAYRNQDGLQLIDMFTGDMTAIEGQSADLPPVRGRGVTMAWTANGDALAYTTSSGARVYFNSGVAPIFSDIVIDPLLHLSWSPKGSYLAGEAAGNIWWIFRREGSQMILTSAIPSSIGLAWISDSALVFAPQDGGLIAMDLADANRQQVLRNAPVLYRLPYLRPDGSLVAFIQDTPDDPSGRLVSVDSTTGQQTDLGGDAIDLTGVRWSPGGQLLTAFQGGVLALVNSANGTGLTLPVSNAVAFGWGWPHEGSVDSISLPTNGFFLAEDSNRVRQVWRILTDGSPPVPMTAAQADVIDYAIAPDKSHVAYISAGTLWLFDLRGGSEPQALAEVTLDSSGGLAFGPGGQTIAYTVNNESASDDAGVWTVSATGGDATQQLAAEDANPHFFAPQYAPNINALLITQVNADGAQLGLLDLFSGTLNPLGAYVTARWLPDGRILAHGPGAGAAGTMSLAMIDPSTSDSAATILTLQDVLSLQSVTVTETGDYRALLVRNSAGPAAVQILDISAAGVPTPAGEAGFIAQPILSPDGSIIVGYTHEGGALVVYDVASGTRSVLRSPAQVWQFRWDDDRLADVPALPAVSSAPQIASTISPEVAEATPDPNEDISD